MRGGPDPRWMAFWMQQCPMRGPALTHKHASKCEEHPRNMCCECGQSVGPPLPVVRREMPPVDIEARLRGQPEESVDDDIWLADSLDAKILEPRMATGVLDGNPSGPGRGPLSDTWVAWASRQNWKR